MLTYGLAYGLRLVWKSHLQLLQLGLQAVRNWSLLLVSWMASALQRKRWQDAALPYALIMLFQAMKRHTCSGSLLIQLLLNFVLNVSTNTLQSLANAFGWCVCRLACTVETSCAFVIHQQIKSWHGGRWAPSMLDVRFGMFTTVSKGPAIQQRCFWYHGLNWHLFACVTCRGACWHWHVDIKPMALHTSLR